MRKLLLWVVPLLILSLVAVLGWRFTTRLRHKQAVTEAVKSLPAFTALTLSGDTVSQQTLQNRAVVLVFIDPDCEHCRHQVEQFRQKTGIADQAEVLLLSAAPISALKKFATAYKLTNAPSLQVAHIDGKAAYETFGFATTPDILIYRANGQLAKHFRGQASAEAILRHL